MKMSFTSPHIQHESPIQYTVPVDAPVQRFDQLSGDEKYRIARDTGRVAAKYIEYQAVELNTDQKTGLGNERRLFKSLERLTQEEDLKESSSLGIIMFDLDKFKLINDTLGHAFGDDVLTFIGDNLPRIVRPSDLPMSAESGQLEEDTSDDLSEAIRKHGDEFFVIVPNLDDTRNGGADLTKEERQQKMVENIELKLTEAVNESDEIGSKLREHGLTFSLSVGAAIYEPNQGVADFLDTVDQNMYSNKNQ